MPEIKPWTAVWTKPDIVVIATMHAPEAKPGRFAVAHRCQKHMSELKVEKIIEDPFPTDADALEWATKYAEENDIPIIYHCDFDDNSVTPVQGG